MRKVISKEDCRVGWYTKIGNTSVPVNGNHIIHNGKPLCNFYVDRMADLNVVSFVLNLDLVECATCKNSWKKNLKGQWKHYD